MNARRLIDQLFEVTHTAGYFWKQTHGYPVKISEQPKVFEMYRLFGPHKFSRPFESYQSLVDYCEENKVNPAQA